MKAIFFDLDNTLYDNKQYFLGAFKEVSKDLSKKFDVSQQKVYKNLIKLWREKTSTHTYLFNDLLKKLNIKNGKTVKNVVKIFNGYRGKLEPYWDVIPTLKKLKKQGYKLGIITDGNVKRQKRKLELLGIKNFFKTIIYTKEIVSKPSEKSFLVAIRRLNVNPEDTFYVADNPLIDFKGAKKVGINTIRIRKGEFKNFPTNKFIDFEIKKINELLKIIIK